MRRPEAESALGLKNFTLVTVAAAGAIRYAKGPEHSLPPRCFFFIREDVMRIKDAFEKYSVPVKEYSKPGEFIALRDAMKNYLGRGAGLATVITAVINGNLVPVGHTKRFRGITGYLFRSADLRKYRPVPDVTAPLEGFLNYKEAAALLEVKTEVIRGLADQSFLTASSGYRNGFARLIAASEVQQFADRYVAVSVLSRRFHLHSGSLARYLKQSGTPLLPIPLPDAGRGHAFFLRRDIADRVQLPTRAMLRDQGQRNLKAKRKERWAEYRRAKETAMGKPMRRVRGVILAQDSGST
jgi:hypothetical protein